MQHHSSTFFISEKSPVVPKFFSFSTPSLTLDGLHSSITLHFDSFKMIKELVSQITSQLEIIEEKTSNGK